MIFEKVQRAKETILSLSNKAFNKKILDEKTFEEIKETLQREKIRVAICGQVKTGKSTFINAYIFGRNILPVASSPTTASLCYITYGESHKAEVEFLSQDEWRELERLAEQKDNEEPKIKAAKEMINEAERIKTELNSLLGTKKVIDLVAISNYAGSDGKYTPVTKSITISLPHEVLKGVDIVDTPGTNDPVISRERRTLEFLKEADVVFLCIYAGRPFDKADEDLLHHLKNSTGKVIIVVNMKDIILGYEDSIEKVEKVERRIKDELEKIAMSIEKEGGSKYTVDMIREAKDRIVFFSSLWAIIGRMSEEEILTNEDMKYHYENFKENFPELKTPEDFYDESGLDKIDKHIKDILHKEKIEILLRKPANLLFSAYEKQIKEAKKEIDKIEIELRSYDEKLEDIESEIKELTNLEKSLKEKFDEYEIKYKDKVNETILSCKEILYTKMEELSKNLNRDIPEKKILKRHSAYQRECEAIFDREIVKVKRVIEKEFEEKFTHLNEDIAKLIKSLFEEVDSLSLSSKLVISFDKFRKAIKELKKEAICEVDIEFNRSIKFKTSGFWIDGTSLARNEILSQIEKEISSFRKNGIKKLIKLNEQYDKKFEYINNKLFEDTLPSIKNPLERAKQNYREQESRKVELGAMKKEREQRIKQLEEDYNTVKKEIEEMF